MTKEGRRALPRFFVWGGLTALPVFFCLPLPGKGVPPPAAAWGPPLRLSGVPAKCLQS